MEGNGCDINRLDSDVLLPPRKRLLAGLKKQNSVRTPPCPQGISSSSPFFGFGARINDLIKSCENGSSMSLDEIAEAAGSAAAAAAKAASVARAAAEDKSSIAAKAVAAAKSALDLVASFSEESGIGGERNHRKNKLKKHVPVEVLYKKNLPVENCSRTDEELARKLHWAINSSPRISKNLSPGFDTKNHKHKKLKVSPTREKDRIPNGVARSRDNVPVPREVDSEGSNEDSYIVRLEDKASKSSTSDLIEENSGEAESSPSTKESIHFEVSDETHTNGRKRGRIKQNKFPFSLLCSFDDQANKPIEADGVLLPIEAAPRWKCQDFKMWEEYSPCFSPINDGAVAKGRRKPSCNSNDQKISM
ncbi:hypothetical protein Dimus_017435 [Dionaea muscipula]